MSVFHKEKNTWMFVDAQVHTTSDWRSRKSKMENYFDDQEAELEAEFARVRDVFAVAPGVMSWILLKSEGVCSFRERGEGAVSKDGFNWRYAVVSFKPFSISVNYLNEQEAEHYDVVYSVVYSTVVLSPPELKFPQIQALRLFLKDKSFIDVSSLMCLPRPSSPSRGNSSKELPKLDCSLTTNQDVLQISRKLDLFWKVAYMKNELEAKQLYIMKHQELVEDFNEICFDRYETTAKYFCSVRNGMEKIRAAKMLLVTKSEIEDVFVILFPHFISIQNDSKKKIVGVIIYKFSYLTVSDEYFSFSTPREIYVLKMPHQTVKDEWLAPLKKFMPTEELPESGRVELPPIPMPHKYKNLTNKMSLVLCDDKGELRSLKLKNSGPWKIGRSRSNDFTIHEDHNFVSRFHCEIEVIDNAPWIKDLGSATGTFVNTVKITKHPLKHADIIKIGNLTFKFEVKKPKLLADSTKKNKSKKQKQSEN